MNSLGRNGKKENSNQIFTKETLGVVLVLFSTLCLVCLITNDSLFSVIGKAINSFLLGIWGYFAYLVTIFGFCLGVSLIIDKKLNFSVKCKFYIISAIILTALLVNAITMSEYSSLSFGEYISTSYSLGDKGFAACSGGGFFASLISYWVTSLLGNVGAYVILSILVVLCVYALVYEIIKGNLKGKAGEIRTSTTNDIDSSDMSEIAVDAVKTETVEQPNEIKTAEPTVKQSVQGTQKLFISNAEDFAFKTKRDFKREENSQGININTVEGTNLNVGSIDQTYSEQFDSEMQRKLNYIKTPPTIDIKKTVDSFKPSESSTTISKPIAKQEQASDIPVFLHEEQDETLLRAEKFNDLANGIEETIDETIKDDNKETDDSLSTPFVNEEKSEFTEQEEQFIPFNEETFSYEEEVEETEKEPESVEEIQPPVRDSKITSDRNIRNIFGEEKENVAENQGLDFTSRVEKDGNLNSRRTFNSEVFGFGTTSVEKEPEIQEEKEEETEPINREYFRPSLDLLESYTQVVDDSCENHQGRMETIKQTLAEYKINAEPQGYVHGPSITRYEIMMQAGVPVRSILNHDKELQMRLESRNEVRIEAPIPGKNLVGVEVANNCPITVGLKEVLEGMKDEKFSPSSLMFAIGKTLVGKSKADNLAKGPHYLVAGATGMGKSVFLNVMIVSLIMRYSPEELRLILVDPKRVEFRKYEHLPHLMIDEIIMEPQRVLAVLSWACEEMERRYQTFSALDSTISDIDAYNESVASDKVAKMPRIVIIVDELADLMETCKKDLEARIRRLVAKARAAGIHLVLATQRPSVDVITGTIKANIASRIAFRVTNFTDSQTILGEQGAEKLLGNGDMLYRNSTMASVERYQGAYISSREVNNVVSYIKEHNKAYFNDKLMKYLENETNPKTEEPVANENSEASGGVESSELFVKALAFAVSSGTISISAIERRFQVGYARAGGIIDKMEVMGYISGNEGSKARKVLLTREGFESKYGPLGE